MHLCPRIVLSKNRFFKELLSKLVEKTKQLYVLTTLAKCHSAIISVDLCILKVGHDIFALVIKFLKVYWQPKHIALGLSEPRNTSG